MPTTRTVSAFGTADARPLDLVIFGGAGDLSARKLLPSLYMCHRDGNLPDGTRIIGVGRHRWDREAFVNFADESAQPFVDARYVEPAKWQGFLQRLDFVHLDAAQAADYPALAAQLRSDALRIYYMAMPPGLFAATCDNLASHGLIADDTRLVLEKPLGVDLASAIDIGEVVSRYFSEDRTYRIDHYLGKETVQNLMALRFGNSIFEPLWRTPFVRSVQITVAETVGVGTRGGFYDEAGAMRDMVQNHLLQLVSILAMEPPASLNSDAVRDEKLKVLRSLRPMSPEDVRRNTVRGQYTAGAIGGELVRGYLQEEGIPPDSRTETFVAMRAELGTWRWNQVPFYLRTGKRMQERVTEVVIHFAEVPHSIFDPGSTLQPNRMVIRLQPEESVRLTLMVKQPGEGMRLKPLSLALNLDSAFTTRRAEAYERLLLDVIRGRLALFVRRDELQAAWTWVDPILEAWRAQDEGPRPYTSGTWGPAASSAFMAREGVQWSEEA
ncbi:glucose-6-phosphate dehydrogenase [Cupriavidus taiwanensis]|uniref:Glucose-6-phosphate 1-dehydrogenase n=1 Tax=Cupriavidus taiwanensis TaxID=164546 RepID=A0A375J2C2_9BURK|nr:glucose-6-phosphate dehydrogenase [Cupriavidus taiwanensis]SPR98761.1 glucose-6-phosphate dehydrogenase [Cupriavidus taiwanensis]